jgi:hypothetical protein
MNVKRTATIVLAGAAIAAWLSAAITPGGRSVVLSIAREPTADARGANLAEETARLHEHLRPDAAPRHPARNLFTFRSLAARPSASLVAPSASTEVGARLVAPLPALTLEGIAEEGTEAPIRTAIISAGGQLHLVKEGDAVTVRYRVKNISADVVELTDVGDGSIRRLALK